MAARESPLANQPWWVNVVVKVGVPTAAFCYLLWVFTSSFATKLDAMITVQQTHQVEMANLVTQLRVTNDTQVEAGRTREQQAWAQLSVLQRICLNTAKTDADRIACATLTGRAPQ